MKRFPLIILFLCGFLTAVNAQSGTEFWFVAPDATSDHADSPIYLRVSTYGNACTVNLSLPADASFTPLSVSLPANTSHTFDLTPWLNTIESGNYNKVGTNGILVTSTNTITAYYEVGPSNNTDIFALKADNALGRNFLVSAQDFWKSATKYNPRPYNTTHIVASQNNTSVTIIPSKPILGHPAGVPFTVTLNRGETYSLRANGLNANNRYGGTEIESDKPIAVTISDDSIEHSAYGGCKDIIGDQTIPLENIGSEYIISQGFLGNGGTQPDRVYIMAVENNTDIFLDGSGTPISINKGQSHEVVLSNNSLHIQSTKDVYVMHVTGFGCEVGMAILPSIYCTGSTEVSFTRSHDQNFYIVAIVPSGAQGNFEINGNKNLLRASDFSVVAGTNGNWLYARKKFGNNKIVSGQNYRVTNKTKFHLGIINGGSSTGCLYGYFTDFAKVLTGSVYHY